MTTMLTYGESPLAAQVDPQWHSRIVHATLQVGDIELTGTDVLPEDYRLPQGFFVTVTIEDPRRAPEISHALASGGEIRLAFQRTFWSPGFGVLVDEYAVPWEINSVLPVASAKLSLGDARMPAARVQRHIGRAAHPAVLDGRST